MLSRLWLGQIRRRAALGLGLAAAAGLQAAPAPFPSRAVTLWVPWSAGGATDLTLRLLAELAGARLGEPVVTENRGGAGGSLVMPLLQSAEPDGYTIAQMPYPVFRIAHTQKVLWDPIRDTTPIIQVSGVTFGLLVGSGSRFRGLDDLFAYARAHPGELSIATNGIGTTPHVVLESLFTARGLRYIHVPYKGTGEQVNAVASGQVMAGVSANGFGPALEAGALRLLVVFSAQRSRRWAQVPTLRELGHDIAAQSPYGLVGPRGMPPAVVQQLHDAFKAAMFDARFITELAKYDQELDYLNSADYARALRAVDAAERRLASRAGQTGRTGQTGQAGQTGQGQGTVGR